jgi:leader peptidase (prepilin peptidase)/N-methyltransferase
MASIMIAASDTLGWLFPLLLAPFAGSFLGVLIQRLPADRPVVWSRSACDDCGHRLGAGELVPLVSYIVLRGRCRHCRQPIGWFAPGIELAAVAVAAWAAITVPDEELWITCGLGWTLLALAWIDIRHMILPDVLTLPLLVAGLVATELVDPESLADHTIAAAGSYLALAAVAWGYRRLRGRDGLGMGDAKLLAASGAWLGLEDISYVLILAAGLGLLAAAGAALGGRRIAATTAMPFGPWLALATWLLWLYGRW